MGFAVYSRRRIAAFLNETPLEDGDRYKLVQDLNDPKKHLAASWELTILHALHCVDSSVCFYPKFGNKRPEAYSENFFGRPVVLEVKTVGLSGNQEQNRRGSRSPIKNTPNNALRNGVEKQFRDVPDGIIRIAILCDGGHISFNRPTENDLIGLQNHYVLSRNFLEYRAPADMLLDVAAIADHFLTESQSVDAVFYIARDKIDGGGGRAEEGMRNGWRYGLRMKDWSMFKSISSRLDELMNQIPRRDLDFHSFQEVDPGGVALGDAPHEYGTRIAELRGEFTLRLSKAILEKVLCGEPMPDDVADCLKIVRSSPGVSVAGISILPNNLEFDDNEVQIVFRSDPTRKPFV